MMKKILVVFTGSMDLGGIERSLLGLLDAVDYDKYQVDLFLYAHHGPLFSLINKDVNILPEVKELAYLRESFASKLKHGCYYSAFLRVRDAVISKFKPVNYDETWAGIMEKCAPMLETEYDLAISFFRPFDFLMKKVKARKKVGWIHTDYSSIDADIKALRADYSRLDAIIAVSEECRKSFCTVLPELEEKTAVIENIMSRAFIETQAMEEEPVEMKADDCIKLLTVGRYCEAKRQDEIPEICKRVVSKGVALKWYLIGFGAMEGMIKQKIAECGMQDYVIMLGKKDNPYPYMKACDIYVQPSRYEGKCVAVREAQMLHKPVIITRYTTASSQLSDGIDGIIVPMKVDACADGIADAIRNKELLEQLIIGTHQTDYTNSDEIKKIYRMTVE